MQSITKRDLVDQITAKTSHKRPVVKEITQEVLNTITSELVLGHRIEMRDFGVFDVVFRPARTAQNPKTLEPVYVPPKYTVRFKPGRLMKQEVEDGEWAKMMLLTRDAGDGGGPSAKEDSGELPLVHTITPNREVPKNY